MIDTYKYIIEIIHLNKSFNSIHILEDINLNVKRGETIAVLGKSGTGKSVILQCIIGLLKPEKGEVIAFGNEIFSMSEKGFNEFRKKTGFLFQSGALYDSMSVRENLEFPLKRHYKLSKNELEIRVKKSLEEVGLLEAIDKMPSELSGGMRKRIGLARTLILQPDIILYDEPTTGLDPATSREISKLTLEVPDNYEDNHSIANEFGIYQLAYNAGININEITDFDKEKLNSIYFKWLIAKNGLYEDLPEKNYKENEIFRTEIQNRGLKIVGKIDLSKIPKK